MKNMVSGKEEKQMKKEALSRICGLILAFAVIISCCQISTFRVWASVKPAEISSQEYYGRNALKGMENGENLVFAYEQVAKGVERSEASIVMHDSAHSVSKDELRMVFTAYKNDYPQHFWVGNSYQYSYSAASGMIFDLQVSYTMETMELAEAKTKFNSAVNEVASGISADMCEYDREKLIHDRLADRIEYDGGSGHVHNAYGALVQGKAVCDGYAKAFQYALYKVGILSTMVSGTAANPTGSGGHAWNLVRIDGVYYYADLTWNDQGENRYYAYFNLPFSEMSEDHTLENMGYTLPECTSIEANYFTVNGGRMSEYTVDKLVAVLKKDLVGEIYLTGNRSNFTNWLQTNMPEIARKCGIVGGYSYSYSVLGREYIIRLNGTRQTVPVSSVKMDISSYTFEKVGETFKLNAVVSPSNATNDTVTFSSSNTNVAVVNKYTGLVTAKGEGTANITVTTQDGNKTAVCTVTVRGEQVNEELSINLYGNGSLDTLICRQGDMVQFRAIAAGGEGEYTYSYLLHNIDTNAWYRFSDFKADNELKWKAESAGNREFFAEVRDKTGKTVRSSAIKVTVNDNKELKITGTSSASRVRVGETITFTGIAEGGDGSYTYSYLLHNKDNGDWYRFSAFQKSNILTWNAGSVGNREFFVEVKDGTGKVVRSDAIDIVVTEENALNIVGKSSTSLASLGQTVILTGMASGGSGNYTYSFLVCNTDTGAWYRFSGFQASNSLRWAASGIGNREFFVEVKDGTGKIVRSGAMRVGVR